MGTDQRKYEKEFKTIAESGVNSITLVEYIRSQIETVFQVKANANMTTALEAKVLKYNG
jgi:hypothetical protein